MFTRRQRKPPKGGHQSALQALVHRALANAQQAGTRRTLAGPWLAAARVLLVTRQSCGWDLATTERDLIEGHLRTAGLTCRWEGEGLVIELPGWFPPVPVVVAVQPNLFENLWDVYIWK
jgi:hypothetical protein